MGGYLSASTLTSTAPKRIVLFGSAARCTMTRDSYLDMLVLSVGQIIAARRLKKSCNNSMGWPFGKPDDLAILQYSDDNDFVITTKDSDFTSSFWLNNRPRKLLLNSTGNINNKELEVLISTNFDQIVIDLSNNRFVELNLDHIVVHA